MLLKEASDVFNPRWRENDDDKDNAIQLYTLRVLHGH